VIDISTLANLRKKDCTIYIYTKARLCPNEGGKKKGGKPDVYEAYEARSPSGKGGLEILVDVSGATQILTVACKTGFTLKLFVRILAPLY